jgi:membrane protein
MSVRTALARVAPDRPAEGWASFLRRATAAMFRALVKAFSRNNLLTYASAIAFQVFIAAVALVLLGLALIDLLSLEEIWTDNIAPFVRARLLRETFAAIDTTVERIFQKGSLTLLVVAALLAVWEVSGAVRAISGALNDICGCAETRSIVRRFVTTLGLAVAVIVCLVGAVLAANVVPRIAEVPGALGQAIGWLGAIFLVAVAVFLLLRYAPSMTEPVRWASVGSIFVVVAWVVATLLFGYYAKNIADYRSATGNLVVLLTLAAYLYTSSIIFLTGAQIDELLRRQAKRGRTGLAALTTLDRVVIPDTDGSGG